jgi:hypothetical protein
MARAGYRTIVAVDGRRTSPRSETRGGTVTTDELDALPTSRGMLERGAALERYTVLELRVAGVELSAFVDGLHLRPLWEHPDAARLREQAAILRNAVRGEQRPALAPP